MLYLLLTICCSSALAVVMRLSNGHVKDKLPMIAANYLASLLAAWAYRGFSNPISQDPNLSIALTYGACNGFFYLLAMVINQYSITANGVILSSVFSKIGALLIPLLFSLLLFRESPTAIQTVGILLSFVSIFALNYRKEAGSAGKFRISLLVLLLADGTACVMSKVLQGTGYGYLSDTFLFITFLTSFLLWLVLIAVKKQRFTWKSVLFGIGIGVPNFFSARLILLALEEIPAVVVYPVRSVGTILLITLIGTIFFHERLRKPQIVAMAAVIASLILLNL